jgi:DNA-binding transcriptional regulator YiaG
MDMSVSVDDLVNELPNPPEDLMASERRDLETVRRWVDWILVGVDRLNSRFLVDSSALLLVRELALQNAFLACVYSLRGRAEIGKASLVHAWIDSSSSVGLDEKYLRNLRNLWVHHSANSPFNLTADDSELLAIFNAAVAERLLAEGAEWQGRQVIRQLTVRLGLTWEEVAAMFQVSVQTLEAWESGQMPIPKAKLADVQAASNALSKLLSMFRPERLPQLIRRPAELFDNTSAADWIVAGRIADVAERYESALAYQA